MLDYARMNDSKTDTATYEPQAVEAKWQRRWQERKTNTVDLQKADRPFYQLMMFPYPSAEGLHVGNVFAFVGNDIHGRFQRLRGWNVFEPIGFDAFGIHSENYALRVNAHPATLIPSNIARFREQLQQLGLMLNWEHEVSTTDPAYYKWTQWIFVRLFEAGLAEKKRAPVNWCPECKTVLANEQVIDGYCERHPDTRVHQRSLEQWFFKITKYAPRLLDNLEWIDWSESTRAMQRNWVGRSEGAELVFVTPTDEPIRVFTTRPDTVFGATYIVLAPEHPLVHRLTTQEQKSAVREYRQAAAAKDMVSRKVDTKEKTGVFTGSYARNPATGDSIPIWVADYVLMEYGTGAIMAVPAHDERDYDFAQQFRLPITPVIEPAGDAGLPYTGWDGVMMNSGEFNGLPCRDAVPAITRWLEKRALGKLETQYRIHDWCISRQRYWGPPIPIVYCDACGTVPVPVEDLPVELPYVEDFRPDESGVSPLARHEHWYRVPCPRCGGDGRRETDVSDTFLDSSWYFLRYPSTEFDDRPFDPELTRKWLPVTSYIGGNEHAVLHLLYARFITMALHDLGHFEFEEPFHQFRAHGTIVREGRKMSKSRGNVVIPDRYIAEWGADTFRLYLMFLGPYQEGGDFRDEGIVGVRRFLEKVWGFTMHTDAKPQAAVAPEAIRKLHQTIRKVTADIEELRYNTAIAAMMEYVKVLRETVSAGEDSAEPVLPKGLLEPLVTILAPFAPHFAEECWERLGRAGSVFDGGWPTYDKALAVDRALADDAVQRAVAGRPVKKAVYVRDRLVNLVV